VWLIGAAVAVVCGLVVVRRCFTLVHVVGQSMMPTYRDGERVLARRLPGEQARSRDIVAFVPPRGNDHFADLVYRIKRVVAVAGEPSPPWLDPGQPVPPGKLVVLGDNPNSEDSRRYGYVDASAVVAVIRAR
jgi:signal peptidase I